MPDDCLSIFSYNEDTFSKHVLTENFFADRLVHNATNSYSHIPMGTYMRQSNIFYLEVRIDCRAVHRKNNNFGFQRYTTNTFISNCMIYSLISSIGFAYKELDTVLPNHIYIFIYIYIYV